MYSIIALLISINGFPSSPTVIFKNIFLKDSTELPQGPRKGKAEASWIRYPCHSHSTLTTVAVVIYKKVIYKKDFPNSSSS